MSDPHRDALMRHLAACGVDEINLEWALSELVEAVDDDLRRVLILVPTPNQTEEVARAFAKFARMLAKRSDAAAFVSSRVGLLAGGKWDAERFEAVAAAADSLADDAPNMPTPRALAEQFSAREGETIGETIKRAADEGNSEAGALLPLVPRIERVYGVGLAQTPEKGAHGDEPAEAFIRSAASIVEEFTGKRPPRSNNGPFVDLVADSYRIAGKQPQSEYALAQRIKRVLGSE
jgi:hypothetical protein